jgi:translation initiation factor IF-3
MIRISPIRLIGAENEQIGVVDTAEAMRMAQDQGLDLVEIVSDTRPPVCKIMDYGKYKYELSQKERRQRAHSKQTELKEIRLGRSVKIDPHDVQIRVEQSRRFLMAGHKVQITQRFKGREMMHRELGLERLRKIVEDLSDISKVDMSPRWMGRAASIVLSPDKPKIDALKRKLEKDGQLKKYELTEADLAEEPEDIDDDIDDEGDDAEDTGRKKGPKDDRAVNPVDDELRELLGG